MIESRYWKEHLATLATSLMPIENPPRWTERRHCTLLKDISIGLFLLRRLAELKKLSSLTCNYRMKVASFPTRGKCVTYLNLHNIDELYDLTSETLQSKKPLYIANQFIHAYTAVVARDESRNWSDVLLVSDFDRNDVIWRIPIEQIRTVFYTAANDYPHSSCMKWNKKTHDYDIVTN